MDLQQFLNGAVSGTVGTVLSHPIDTGKTHIQNKQAIPRSLVALYRGVGPAIAGVGFEKAVVFGVFGNTREWCDRMNINGNSGLVLSGGLAGLSASLVVTPVDRLKIIAQSGKMITSSDMNPRLLFRGISATFTREVPGFSLYFLTFENLKKKYIDDHPQYKLLPPHMSFAYGGVSGAIAWCAIYPQDVIKTRMQIANNGIGFMATLRQVMGEGALFKGFHLALMRAVPLHAGTFMTMEYLKNL